MEYIQFPRSAAAPAGSGLRRWRCAEAIQFPHPVWILCPIFYFIMCYLLISFGIALSNRCCLPIVPTDLFPRELVQITGIQYPKIKISFDVICLAVTAGLTEIFLGHLDGLGIGTIFAAFTMGKCVGIIGNWLDHGFRFTSFLNKIPGTC